MSAPATASGLVINGENVLVEGLRIYNWHDDPTYRLRVPNDGYAVAKRNVHGLVGHSTRGIPGGSDNRPQRLLPGRGAFGGAVSNAHYWSSSDANGAAHLIVDSDTSILCIADLQREITYHATSVNEVTIGIEIVQGVTDLPSEDGSAPKGYAYFHVEQIAAYVKLLDALTRLFSLPRQIQTPYHGSSHPIARLVAGGHDCYGVYGHRDQTSNRGPGDPGDFVARAVLDAGYEPVDFASNSDRKVWIERQTALNDLGATLVEDGLPGAATFAAIEKYHGRKGGQWVSRPGD